MPSHARAGPDKRRAFAVPVVGADVAPLRGMRVVVGFLVAAAVGIHCSAPPESVGAAAPELVASEAPSPAEPASDNATGTPKSPNHLQEPTRDFFAAIIRDAETTRVTSTVVDPASGATYATGTFVNEVVIGQTLIKSHGDTDVFLMKIDATGTFEWVRAVGSAYAENRPRVTLAGTEVNVIGMTDGAMDCGSGPLATWSSATFFFCVFGAADGTSVSGGVFPTGTP
jgi:hypothetical protein